MRSTYGIVATFLVHDVNCWLLRVRRVLGYRLLLIGVVIAHMLVLWKDQSRVGTRVLCGLRRNRPGDQDPTILQKELLLELIGGRFSRRFRDVPIFVPSVGEHRAPP